MLTIKSTKGFGVVEMLVVVAVLAILGAGAYIYMQGQSSNSGTENLSAAEQAELKAACKMEIDDDVLCAAFSKWGDTSAEVVYTAKAKQTDGETMNMTMKMKGADYHSLITSTGGEMESMSVGGVTYMKMDGVWYRSTAESESDTVADPETNPSSQLEEFVSDDYAKNMSYKRVGEEGCGTATCIKYEVKDKTDADTTNYFWVDKKTSRLMRTVVTSKDGSEYDMTLSYESVTITAPTGAKDFSSMMGM